MNIKRLISNADFYKTVDCIFIVLIFSLPFVSYPFIIDPIKSGQELYLVSAIALWLFFKAVTLLKAGFFKIYILDIAFLIFSSYCIFHYLRYSYFGLFYNGLGIFAGYIALFYLFRWSYEKEEDGTFVFGFTIKLIWLLCTLQALAALLQEFDFLKSDSIFFKVTGTFINPNFLGVYMMIGIFTLVYLFFIELPRNRAVRFLMIFSGAFMAYTLILTQSRASWLALCIGILFFLVTSQKGISFIKNNRIKASGIFLAIILLGVLVLYLLYNTDKNSVDGRAFIQRMTFYEIEKQPILGNGIFNFAGIYNDAKAHYFLTGDRSWQEIKTGDYAALAFNDYLQIIFEIGIAGFLLMASLLFLILKNIRFNSEIRLGLSFVSAFIFLAFFTSVLYNPNAMLYVIWALSIIFIFGKREMPFKEIRSRFVIRGIAVLLIGTSSAAGFVYYKKTAGLAGFKCVQESGSDKIYYKLTDNDLIYIQEDPFVEFQTGYEKYREGEWEKGLEMMENSIRKNPIPNANIALAGLYAEQKRYDKVEKILKENIGIEPSRFEPRNNLLQFYLGRKEYQNANKIAAEIVNLPVKKASPQVIAYKEFARSILEIKE